MTLGNPTVESRDEQIEKVNALLAEIGSYHRYHLVNAPYTERKDVLELTPSGKQLQTIEERGWAVGTHRMYEQLTDNAEVFHTLRVVADLIEKLQDEGILNKKKPRFRIE